MALRRSQLLVLAVMALFCTGVPSTALASPATCPSGTAAVIGPTDSQPSPTLTITGQVATGSFRIAAGCSNIRVSLASYVTQSASFSLPQTYLDSDTNLFSAGGPYTLTTKISPCFYQADLVFGNVITDLTPTNLYGAAKLAYLNGGSGCAACSLTGMSIGPPKSITVTVQDANSGITSIVVSHHSNATAPVSFSTGTKNPVVVTATKIVQSSPAVLELTITNGAGNVTVCDPTDITVSSGDVVGGQARGIHSLPSAESTVRVLGGPVLPARVDLLVNGKVFHVTGLRKGLPQRLNVRSAMRVGSTNTLSVRAFGVPGATADVLVSDS